MTTRVIASYPIKGYSYGTALKMLQEDSHWPMLSAGEDDLVVMAVTPSLVLVIAPARTHAFKDAGTLHEQKNMLADWEIIDG
jgi:hypothetical protein